MADRTTKYKSILEAQKKLNIKGYTAYFEIVDREVLSDGMKTYKPEDVGIVELHQVDDKNNPEDSASIYVLETNNGTNGIVVDHPEKEGSRILADFLFSCEGE